jgi:Flp pilus assembly protein TadB
MIFFLLLAVVSAALALRFAVLELGGRKGTRAQLARAAGFGRAVTVPAPVAIEPPGRAQLPGAAALARAVLRVTPGRERGRTLLQLQAAGLGKLDADTFLAAKAVALAGGFVLGLVLGASKSPAAGLLFGLLFAAIGFVVPDLVVKRRATERRERVLAELPNALELLAVIVEAGLGFDAALIRYADTADGPLADEIALLTTELRVGGVRADALRRLTDRIPAPELKAFTRSVIHADQLGTSLSATLRQQATEARFRRQQVAEERANKLPVKMMFPTVFCIFPVLFVVVLGPPVITMLHSLGR